MKYFLICNPGSKRHKSSFLIEEYKKLLRLKNIDFTCKMTNNLNDAETLTKQAILDNYNVIVAIGGDGTVNRVINGFMKDNEKSKNCKLGILYSGTSPDFCKFHNIPTTPLAAIERLLEGKNEKIDICQIEQRDKNGEKHLSYFSCTANIGIGAHIAKRANAYRKYCNDFFSTFLATVITILKYKPGTFIINDTKQLDNVFNISIGKNPYIASGLKLNLNMTPSNEKFFIFALHNMSKIKLLKLLPKLYSGKIAEKNDLYCKVLDSEIEIKSKDHTIPIQVEFDGDPALWCPIRITIIPKSLTLIK